MTDVGSSELPVGWRIEQYMDFVGCEIEFYYGVYRWMTWIPAKKHWWSRKSEKVTGWRRLIGTRYRESAAEWIKATDAALKLDNDTEGK